MGSERFEQLSELFESLRDLTPEERQLRLERREYDEDIQAEVGRLLSNHDRESPLDGGSPGQLAQAAVTSFVSDPGAAPDRIGPHRVIRRIGEGGMGVVYEVEQESPRRRAAAKVIKLGMDTQQFISRFEGERQALAMMEHPSIAQVLSAGATDDGRPYFVMEYVDGVPLLEHCDSARLTTQERLRLFISVCEAIQHAHQKGVIHRDIKPSNVLATVSNGITQPKVIDFGIARVYSEDPAARTRLTEIGQIVGTPMYMSPEQAEQRVQDIDTRSDIYSLGVLLYELLTGATPFDESSLASSGYAEMLRIISTHDPARPSTRCGESDESSARAAHRCVTPAQLRNALEGDLDWIVMKCLEKEPSRRYSSTGELASDILNYLEERPVLARPQSRGYRLRKYVRRNRAQVVAAAAVLGVLVLGVVGTSTALVWALDERARAEQASRDEAAARVAAQQSAADAEREAATAEEVVSFLLNDLLGAADPARAEDRDLTVRDAVLVAAESVEGRFDERPDVEARVRSTIAHTLTQLSAFGEAEPQLRREHELLTSLHGEISEGAIAAQQALVTNLMQQNRFEDAIALGQDLLALIQQADLPSEEYRLAALGNLGVAHLQLGLYTEAAPILEDTLKSKRHVLGDRHQSTLTSIHNLAGLYGQLGEFEQSLELSREAYAGRLEVLGPGDPRTFGSLNLIAWMLRSLERFDEFESILLSAISEAEERLGPAHSSTIELTKMLALQLYQREKFSEAEGVLQRVLRTQIPLDPDLKALSTLSTKLNLAKAIYEQGRETEAVVMLDDVLPRLRDVYPSNSWELAIALQYYGSSLTTVRRYDDAEGALLESLAIIEEGATRRRPEDLQLITESLSALYDAWHLVVPGKGYDTQAEEWRRRSAP